VLENIAQAVFVSYVLMQFIQALVKPLIDIINAAIEGQPVKEMIVALWPMYATVLVAGSLAWFAGINILPMFPPSLGQVLTCIGIGLGPSFLYDLQDSKTPSIVLSVSGEDGADE
jgi:hypothetical protein